MTKPITALKYATTEYLAGRSPRIGIEATGFGSYYFTDNSGLMLADAYVADKWAAMNVRSRIMDKALKAYWKKQPAQGI